MSVEDRLRHLAESIHGMRVGGFSERETERYLVEPFLDALEYDSRNPNEVQTQLPIRIGSTTKSCDYAIKVGGEVRVLVEAKKSSVSLDSPGQLASYFSQVPNALLGIYTNGIEYRFYAERNEGRVKRMDDAPFLVVDLRHPDPVAMSSVARCSKSHLSDAEGFQHWVTDLAYARAVHDRLRLELTEHPSDELVHLAMAWVGVDVGPPVETNRFREIVRDAARRIVLGSPDSESVSPPPRVGDGRTVPLSDVVGHINSWGTTTGHEMRRRAPKAMELPDGTEVPLRHWYDVVLETARWLHRKQLLTTANCEIQDPGWADFNILSPNARHRDGREFRYGGGLIGDTGIRMNKDLGAIRLMNNAVRLLEHFEQDPSRVTLRFP